MKSTQSYQHEPPLSAATLYVGRVMHARLKPVLHRFEYRVFSLLIDIDKLGEADRQSFLFSVNHLNIFSFYPKDHGDLGQHSLREYVNGLFLSENLPVPAHIFLLCYPRILNFAFNPISVYYCYNASGQVCGLIYEVRNTFGQRHSYFAPLKKGEISAAGIRQERDKLFFVSPFMDMNLRYKFRLRPPQESVSLRIIENDPEGPILSAVFWGKKLTMTSGSLMHLLWTLPFQNLKIVAGIHWEALRLWIKGMNLRNRPPAPLGISVDGVQKSSSDINGNSQKGLK